MKKSIIPLAILIVLIGLYFIRWEKEAPPVPEEIVQLKVTKNVDRWTGQLWGDYYIGVKIFESPIISDSSVDQYVATVKSRPEVKKLLEDPSQTVDVDSLAKETAKLDLTNKAWFIRKALTIIWSLLIALTIIWLISSFTGQRKNVKTRKAL